MGPKYETLRCVVGGEGKVVFVFVCFLLLVRFWDLGKSEVS